VHALQVYLHAYMYVTQTCKRDFTIGNPLSAMNCSIVCTLKLERARRYTSLVRESPPPWVVQPAGGGCRWGSTHFLQLEDTKRMQTKRHPEGLCVKFITGFRATTMYTTCILCTA
jgi:hypothetical protein